jgi:hypothetical protein
MPDFPFPLKVVVSVRHGGSPDKALTPLRAGGAQLDGDVVVGVVVVRVVVVGVPPDP